ncbi:MAG: BCD family MFS transporter [Pseudomonadota bacterium]
MHVVLAWVTIVRFGIVQGSIAAITVLPISTLPRLMIEELSLLAMAPGVLIGIHYAVQISRLRFGYGSDVGGRRTPFIIGGLVALGIAGVLASLSVTLMTQNPALGYAAAILAYALVGIAVGAAGTTLLALLATTVAPERRAPAATIVWFLMILGLVLAATLGGQAMIPFSYARLVEVSIAISVIAVTVGTLALLGIEGKGRPREAQASGDRSAEGRTGKVKGSMMAAFRQVWAEPAARGFTIFVFVSMFAYNMQELVLEPFSAAVFGLSPGESTQLSGNHHMGVLIGLIIIAVVGRILRGRPGALVAVTVGGCLCSAAALLTLAASAFFAPDWPLAATVMAFGVSNGVFAGAAIASMFSLAGMGAERREGTRMGIWGAAQAIGFGLGMFFGASVLDAARISLNDPSAFAAVFALEAVFFTFAALLAWRVARGPAHEGRAQPVPA